MSHAPLNVLVAGAGIAGGSFVSCLLRALPDAQITLVERDPKPRLTGASVDIRSSAVDIIKWMGIEDEIRANGTNEEGVRFVNGKGGEVATFWATGRTDVQSITSEFEIFRGKIAEILLRPALEREQVKMMFDESVDRYKEKDDGVMVTFKKSKETKKYDLLVAADGLRSKIRGQMLDLPPKEQIHGEGMHAAYFTIPGDLLGGSKLALWYNDTKGRCVFLRPDPNPKGATRGNLINATTKSQLETRARLDDAMLESHEAYMTLLEEIFADAGWRTKEVLKGMRQSDDFYCSLFAQVWSEQLVSKRVVLVGDAGYATPGIGTSFAIIGGYVLAGELLRSRIDSQEFGDMSEALKRYEEIMLPFVKGFRQDNSVPQLLNPQTWWGLGIRNALLSVVGTLRLDRAAMWAFGGSDKNPAIPEYPWPERVEKTHLNKA